MGTVGDCYDNALAESLFATVECELLQRVRLTNREEAKTAIFRSWRASTTAAGATRRWATWLPWNRAFLERGARGRSEARASPRPRGVFGGIEESIDRPGGRNGRPVSSRTPRGPSVDEFPAVVFHFVSTKFFRLFRCKAEEFCGLIHYCRKELQWRA